MSKVLVVYHSETGNTKKMAEAVAEGVREVDGVTVEIKSVENASEKDLVEADGIILGAPTYFGQMSAKMKEFIDKSISVWQRLEGKVGAAFTTSLWEVGGNETALLSMVYAMLCHGMVIVGQIDRFGCYGACGFSSPSKEQLAAARKLGRKVAETVKKLKG